MEIKYLISYENNVSNNICRFEYHSTQFLRNTKIFSISRTELLTKQFDCDSVIILFTDSTQRQAKAKSIVFNDNKVTVNGAEKSSQFDLSTIVQVNTKRNQSNGGIIGLAIGGMIGYGASSIAPGIDSSSTTFRRIFTTFFCAGIGWLIGHKSRTEYQIDIRNSLSFIPASNSNMFFRISIRM